MPCDQGSTGARWELTWQGRPWRRGSRGQPHVRVCHRRPQELGLGYPSSLDRAPYQVRARAPSATATNGAVEPMPPRMDRRACIPRTAESACLHVQAPAFTLPPDPTHIWLANGTLQLGPVVGSPPSSHQPPMPQGYSFTKNSYPFLMGAVNQGPRSRDGQADDRKRIIDAADGC
jgi:hypothetical protein